MPFVGLTRLRLRSIRFLPARGLHTMRLLEQVKRAPGFRGGALLPDRRWTFWTITAWNGPAAMPRLIGWCDQASVAHWEQAGDTLPGWEAADARLRAEGRPSKLRHPAPGHADLSYPPPRTRLSGPIAPAAIA